MKETYCILRVKFCRWYASIQSGGYLEQVQTCKKLWTKQKKTRPWYKQEEVWGWVSGMLKGRYTTYIKKNRIGQLMAMAQVIHLEENERRM